MNFVNDSAPNAPGFCNECSCNSYLLFNGSVFLDLVRYQKNLLLLKQKRNWIVVRVDFMVSKACPKAMHFKCAVFDFK